MNSSTYSRGVTAALIVSILVACGDAPTDPSTPLPPMEAGTWHVHSANGLALPALVAHGLDQGDLMQTFLDSLQLVVGADGRWEQRAWLAEFRAGLPTGHLTRQDAGAWVVTDTGYLFTSDVRDVRYVVRDPSVETLPLHLRAEGIPGVITATLQRTLPPAAPTGIWRGSSVHGRPLPDAIYVFDPTIVEGREVSVHLVVDSARFEVLANGRYVHRTWVSEWEGAVGGPPVALRGRYSSYDHGLWSRTGQALEFTSTWLQNHAMDGQLNAPGSLRVDHGLTHGDPPADFRYAR